MQWKAFEAFAVSLQQEAVIEKVAKEVAKEGIMDVFKEVVK